MSEYFNITLACPDGHEIETQVVFDDGVNEKCKRLMCPECKKEFEVWVKIESRPVVVTNSEPQWI